MHSNSLDSSDLICLGCLAFGTSSSQTLPRHCSRALRKQVFALFVSDRVWADRTGGVLGLACALFLASSVFAPPITTGIFSTSPPSSVTWATAFRWIVSVHQALPVSSPAPCGAWDLKASPCCTTRSFCETQRALSFFLWCRIPFNHWTQQMASTQLTT